MRNGSWGVRKFGSNNICGSKQLSRAKLRGLHSYKRNEIFFFLYAAENAESEPLGNTAAHLALFAKEENDVLLY